jgi:hypothetical protein
LHSIFRTFFAFSHFLIFLLHVSQLVHHKLVKKCEKMWETYEKSAKKCEMQMRCENRIKICITSQYYSKKFAFSHFFSVFCIIFASHYHPWEPLCTRRLSSVKKENMVLSLTWYFFTFDHITFP